MAAGLKQNETRSWPTHYRGPLAICAAKRRLTFYEVSLARTYLDVEAMPLRYGCVLCIVDLYDCVPTSEFQMNPQAGPPAKRSLSQAEWDLGDYTPGRFAWLTRNCRRLETPVAVVGRQGLFNVEL